jgi:hypothetical protein
MMAKLSKDIFNSCFDLEKEHSLSQDADKWQIKIEVFCTDP